MSIEAMKQALEALEDVYANGLEGLTTAPMEALRQAIEQAEQPVRKPMTEPELNAIEPTWPATWNYDDVLAFARAIERAHGIGEV